MTPSGLGGWVAHHDRFLRGNIEQWVPFCNMYGISWLAIRVNGPVEKAKLLTYLEPLKKASIGLYVWRYGYPDDPKFESDWANSLLVTEGIDGYIFNGEVEFERGGLQKNRDAATAIMKGIRDKHPSAYLAHCPFPYIKYHLTFPYEEFGRYCDQVIVQSYWTAINTKGALANLSAIDAQWDEVRKTRPDIGVQWHLGVTCGRESGWVSAVDDFRMRDFDDFLSHPRAHSIYSLEVANPWCLRLLEQYQNIRSTALASLHGRRNSIAGMFSNPPKDPDDQGTE